MHRTAAHAAMVFAAAELSLRWSSGWGARERQAAQVAAETGTELASDFDEAWDASGRHVTFLGDWHTHPGGPTVPSERDREAMEKLATQSAYRTPEPLIVIVQSPWPWSRTSRDFTCYLRRSNEAVVALALF